MRGEQSLGKVVQKKRAFEKNIVQKKHELEKLEKREFEKLSRQLSKSRSPVVVVFTDLCGSTELKRQPQEKWLPVVGEFLLDVTRCVIRRRGRVVKYVGDEVLAVFERSTAKVLVSRAECFIQECEAELRRHGESIGKYALDIGRIVPVSVPGGASDVLGACVDRCARIGKLLSPGTALASADFVIGSSNRAKWRRITTVNVKGIDKGFDVYQLDGIGKRITAREIRERTGLGAGLVQKVSRLDYQLKVCREELDRLRAR